MRILGILLAAGLVGGTAEAAKLSCSGSVMNYYVLMNATMSGAKFTSKANVTVTHNDQVVKKMSMKFTRSEYVPQEKLSFTAESVEGKVTFTSTTYDGSAYAGVVVATSPVHGSMSASGTCIIN